MTIFHLRDMAAGQRRILKAANIKILQVPHYDGLTIKNMLEFAKPYVKVTEALPIEPREVEKLPREYITNIINTLVGDDFQKWVKCKIAERHQKLQQEMNMTVNLDPEIAEIFKASKSISGKLFLKSFTK